MTEALPHPPWFARRPVRYGFWLSVAVVVVVEGLVAIFHRENDFVCHWNFGADFWQGEPYRNAGNVYPLGRAIFDGGLALMQPRLARAVCFLAAILALTATCWMWWKLTYPESSFWDMGRSPTVAVSLIIAAPLLLRDLDECGLQVLLAVLLSAAAYALARGRPWVSGLLLAAGATYKATPLLFLPFLLWKRQWKAAASMTVFILVLNIPLPAWHLGWSGSLAANRHWIADAARILSKADEAYPSNPGVEPPKVQNLSLRAMIARYVESYPPGHPLALQYPLFFQFGDLPPWQAKAAVSGAILLLGACVAWRFRRPWRGIPWGPQASGVAGESRRFAYEWGVACMGCALLSPICWKQHLVLALPVVMLAVDQMLASDRRDWSGRLALALGAGVLLFGRMGIVGHDLSIVLLSYKIDTMALLAFGWLASPAPRPMAAATPVLGAPCLRKAA